MKYIWRALLMVNNVLKRRGKSGYQALVVTAGKKALNNADIARIIVESRSELNYNTLLYILEVYDSVIREYLQRGYSIQNGFCRLTPKILGVWDNVGTKYDPSIHKLTVEMIPGYELRKALEEVSVAVVGEKNPAALVGLVTDVATGATNGNITPDDAIYIDGKGLKIAPDGDEHLGVFFVNADGMEIPALRLLQNFPKQLIVRTPNLPKGKYTLKIVTRYSASGKLLLAPRVIEYMYPLTVL
jgi:hypothetical protein